MFKRTNKNNRLPYILLTMGAFFAFFIFGFTDNLKGPAIPEMLKSLGLSYSDGSNILLLSYLGFMISTLIAGPLADRFGNKIVMIIAGLILSLGLGGTGFFAYIPFLYLTFFFIGFGIGTIEIAANGIIVDIYPEKNGFYLNILAFFHGVGAMIAPLFASKMITSGYGWNNAYKFSLLLPVLLSLSFLSAYIFKGKKQKNKEIGSVPSGIFKVINKELILFGIIIAAYVSAEIGISSWIVEFLQKEKSMTLVKSSLYLSLYFAFITGGRLLGSTIVDLIGHSKILKISSIASLFLLIIGIYSPSSFAIVLPLTGFFFSIIFPTLTAFASERNLKNRGSVFGFLFFFAGLGGMIGPWTVGFVAQYSNIKWGMSLSILFVIIMTLLLFFIDKKDK